MNWLSDIIRSGRDKLEGIGAEYGDWIWGKGPMTRPVTEWARNYGSQLANDPSGTLLNSGIINRDVLENAGSFLADLQRKSKTQGKPAGRGQFREETLNRPVEHDYSLMQTRFPDEVTEREVIHDYTVPGRGNFSRVDFSETLGGNPYQPSVKSIETQEATSGWGDAAAMEAELARQNPRGDGPTYSIYDEYDVGMENVRLPTRRSPQEVFTPAVTKERVFGEKAPETFYDGSIEGGGWFTPKEYFENYRKWGRDR